MQFVCRVGTPDGRVMEEVFNAADEMALRTDLGKRGLHIFEVRRRGVPTRMAGTASAAGRMRRRRSARSFRPCGDMIIRRGR